jgi:hypothetical protein
MAKKKDTRPTLAHAQTIEMVSPILTSLASEIRELSKRKQDGILSPLKVTQINRVLVDLRRALGEDPSTRYLDLLDDDTLPQNSDAVIVLAQWESAVDQFKDKHQGYDDDRDWVWFLRGDAVLETRR